jgi:hypothetical protein
MGQQARSRLSAVTPARTACASCGRIALHLNHNPGVARRGRPRSRPSSRQYSGASAPQRVVGGTRGSPATSGSPSSRNGAGSGPGRSAAELMDGRTVRLAGSSDGHSRWPRTSPTGSRAQGRREAAHRDRRRRGRGPAVCGYLVRQEAADAEAAQLSHGKTKVRIFEARVLPRAGPGRGPRAGCQATPTFTR